MKTKNKSKPKIKKVITKEEIISASNEFEDRDKLFAASASSDVAANDKFEELDLEDVNETQAEEDAEEEGLNYAAEEKKHYDDEEVEVKQEAKENLRDHRAYWAKSKKSKKPMQA